MKISRWQQFLIHIDERDRIMTFAGQELPTLSIKRLKLQNVLNFYKTSTLQCAITHFCARVLFDYPCNVDHESAANT